MVRVAELRGVLPAGGQFIQKRVERRHEIPAVFKVPLVELRELKDEGADVITEGLAGMEE